MDGKLMDTRFMRVKPTMTLIVIDVTWRRKGKSIAPTEEQLSMTNGGGQLKFLVSSLLDIFELMEYNIDIIFQSAFEIKAVIQKGYIF